MSRLNISSLPPILFTLALVGYFLPWILTPASSLNLGAYDLAEWSSLHPVVRQTVPFLWTALALRIPLAILGMLFAAYLGKIPHRTPIAIVCLVVTSLALLPPLEFFTTFRDDPNYRQQFILALLTIVIGVFTVIRQQKKIQLGILVVLSVLGAVSSGVGLYQAHELVQAFDLPIRLGLGGVITSISFAAVACLYIAKQSS